MQYLSSHWKHNRNAFSGCVSPRLTRIQQRKTNCSPSHCAATIVARLEEGQGSRGRPGRRALRAGKARASFRQTALDSLLGTSVHIASGLRAEYPDGKAFKSSDYSSLYQDRQRDNILWKKAKLKEHSLKEKVWFHKIYNIFCTVP